MLHRLVPFDTQQPDHQHSFVHHEAKLNSRLSLLEASKHVHLQERKENTENWDSILMQRSMFYPSNYWKMGFLRLLLLIHVVWDQRRFRVISNRRTTSCQRSCHLHATLRTSASHIHWSENCHHTRNVMLMLRLPMCRRRRWRIKWPIWATHRSIRRQADQLSIRTVCLWWHLAGKQRITAGVD